MKRTVTARLYSLTTQGTIYELTASSAADFAAQVQQLTGSRQAAQLARLSWGDDQADVTAAGMHLVAVGRIVRETWRTLPVARTAAIAVSVSIDSNSGKAIIDDVPAAFQHSEPDTDLPRPLRTPPQPPERQDGDTSDQFPWQDDG